jgi:hypothetical protein
MRAGSRECRRTAFTFSDRVEMNSMLAGRKIAKLKLNVNDVVRILPQDRCSARRTVRGLKRRIRNRNAIEPCVARCNS